MDLDAPCVLDRRYYIGSHPWDIVRNRLCFSEVLLRRVISSAHELDSIMLYVHPPLSIIGYFFIFLFTVFLFRASPKGKRLLNSLGLAAWLFTFLGLVTGMLWAQISWGSYWSWDPKETMTLLLFVSVSGNLVAYREGKLRLTKWLSSICCILAVLTMSMSFIIAGLHSFI